MARAEGKKRGCLKKFLYLALALFLALGAFLWSGWPQRATLTYVLEGVTGLDADVERLRFVPALTLRRLALTRPAASEAASEKLLEVEGLTAPYDYAALRAGANPLRAVQIARLGLQLDDAAFAYLARFSAGDSGPAPDETGSQPLSFGRGYAMSVRDSKILVERKGYGFLFEGLGMEAALSERPHGQFEASRLRGWVKLGPDLERIAFDQGRIHAQLDTTGSAVTAVWQADLPGLVQVAGNAEVPLPGHTGPFAIAIEQGDLTALAPLLNALMPVPLAFRSLDASGTHITGIWDEQGGRLDASTLALTVKELVVGEPDAPAYRGDLSLSGSGEGRRASAALALNRGQVVTLEVDLEAGLEATAAIDGWSLEDLRAVTPEAYRGYTDLLATLGTLDAQLAWAPQADGYAVTLDAVPHFAGAAEAQAALALSAKATLDATRTLRAIEATARVYEGELAVHATNLAVEAETARTTADLHLTADVAAWAKYMALGEMSGDLEVSAPVAYRDARLQAPFTLTLDGLGFAVFGFPYGTPVAIAGSLDLDTTAQAGAIAPFAVRIGEGTRLEAARADLTLNPPAFAVAEFELTSDGLALIEANLVDDVTGTFLAMGDVSANAQGIRTRLTYAANLERLVLKDKLAVFAGANARGDLVVEDGLSGAGTLEVAEAATLGLALKDISAPVQFEATALHVRGIESETLGGHITMDMRIGLLEEGSPIAATARLRQIDLAEFVKTFEPPGLVLTGIANGSLRVAMDAKGLTDLHLTLRSTRDFTMNREMILQLLATQYAGIQALDKVVLKTLGETEQRPFDQAEIVLDLVAGAITGEAHLQSANLDLHITLNIDPRTVLELIRIQQETQLDQIGGIQVEP